jgi:hypothetical protein
LLAWRVALGIARFFFADTPLRRHVSPVADNNIAFYTSGFTI